jgi:predicted ribosomally synthesized peptide with SipW-like signal peptide
MTDEKKLSLSRRELLGGIGAVGLAGAGSGLGTSAVFNDVESFENNSITAGTLDMTVDAEIVAANEYYTSSGSGPDIIGQMETADGAAVVGLQAGDVKPGDWLIVCFEITIEDNPGYVLVQANNLVSNENGFEEPEPSDSNNEGELDDKLLTTVWDDYDDGGTRSGLSTLDVVTNNGDAGVQNTHSWDSSRSEGGEVNDDFHYTTLQETYDDWFDDGFLLGPGPDTDASKIGGPGNDQESKVVYLLLEVPEEVGNEIQGDGVSFDLVFEAEQVRNNDDPFEPSEPPIIAQTDADETIPVRELGEDPNENQYDALERLDLSDPFTLAVKNDDLAGGDSTDYAVTAFYDGFDEVPNDRLSGPSTPLEFDENGIASVTIGSSGTNADVTTWIAPGSLSGDASLVNNIEVPAKSGAIAVETE